jgi:3-phenylpropionate/trans-cinnamate dioxygenase ferredoxin reductase subunit
MTQGDPISRRVVIIGAGQAGHQLAASLRDQGMTGPVILIGDEPHPPYQRPPLSKAYLAAETIEDLGLEELAFRPPSFFADRHITLRLNQRARRIDRAARTVILESGEAVAYDHLVLATGARNRRLPIPGMDFSGVMQLRGLDDAFALRQRLQTARRVAVIGAGFIGLECAATAAKRGLPVTVVESAARVMARAVSPEISAAFEAAHRKAGVDLRFGAMAKEILGETGAATGLRLADGAVIDADLIIVGVGVLPNQGLAAEAGLSVGDGVIVDELLLTSDPSISAIGDCALFPSPYAPAPVRLESVQNAVDQARCVAARLVGQPADYTALPWFWSDQGALKLQIAGLSIGSDKTALRRHPTRAESFSAFLYRADKLIAVESVNAVADHMTARQILSAGFSPTPEQAADPAIDLKALAKAAA